MSNNHCTHCNIDKFILSNNKCILCNILYNFNIKYIYYVILCKSKLIQESICYNTITYLINNKKFPTPFEIDNKCKIINYSTYKFILLKQHLSEKYNKKYKIFFLPNVLELNKSNFFSFNSDNIIYEKKNLKEKTNKKFDKIFYKNYSSG